MSGLARTLKLYGRMKIKGADGKEVLWLYDYANDKPRLSTEMTKEEIAASEKYKWEGIKKHITKLET